MIGTWIFRRFPDGLTVLIFIQNRISDYEHIQVSHPVDDLKNLVLIKAFFKNVKIILNFLRKTRQITIYQITRAKMDIAGINQCQIRTEIDLTFEKILRSMLRQAPNIILIGEIRDGIVADIAIQAALTGHLVFSTLHTNDAPSAIARLIDMGVKPFLVASSIQAIMAQRLVRVICKECKQVDKNPDPRYLRLLNIKPDDTSLIVHLSYPYGINDPLHPRLGIVVGRQEIVEGCYLMIDNIPAFKKGLYNLFHGITSYFIRTFDHFLGS